ncbi:hypothetical protein PFISCL1PPCAC_19786, partial [Pristionchus fissidentatus]
SISFIRMVPDGLWFFLIASSSSFFTAASRNVLFHVFDIRTPFVNWLEQFSLFIFLWCLFKMGVLSRGETFDRNLLYRSSFLYFVESFISSIVHSQMRTGQLFTMRIFDFIFSCTLLFLSRHNENEKGSISTRHMILLSLGASLAWLEWGQMEYIPISLIASPLLQIVKAFRIISIKEEFATSRVSIESFSLEYSTLNTVVLFLPAFFSFLSRDVQITASWESIDYTLLGLAPLWLAVYLFSDLWQITQLNIREYIISEHSRLTLASCGQWILQNMAHPSLIALSGKITFGATLMRNGGKLVNLKKDRY